MILRLLKAIKEDTVFKNIRNNEEKKELHAKASNSL